MLLMRELQMQERCMLQLYFKDSLGSVAKVCVLQKVVKFLQSVFVIEGCEVAIKYLTNSLRSVA